jgi:adenosylmethionine-8-amino-7-oxononanoate aminotransferase
MPPYVINETEIDFLIQTTQRCLELSL